MSQDHHASRMRLFWSSRSPFVRKVMICAHECGIAERLELDRVQVGSMSIEERLLPFSPLNRIPALVTSEGRTIFGSGVVCRYMAMEAHRPDIIPTPGSPEYFDVLLLEELADGMMDFSTGRVAERNRAEPSLERLQKSRRKLVSALDWLESKVTGYDPLKPDIGQMALMAAVGHLDFREPDIDWREGRARLSGWFDGFSARPSAIATVHDEVY